MRNLALKTQIPYPHLRHGTLNLKPYEALSQVIPASFTSGASELLGRSLQGLDKFLTPLMPSLIPLLIFGCAWAWFFSIHGGRMI